MSDDERLEELEICKYLGRHRCVWGGGGGGGGVGTLLESDSNSIASVTQPYIGRCYTFMHLSIPYTYPT